MNALTRFECMRPADCALPALMTPSSAGQSLLQALPGLRARIEATVADVGGAQSAGRIHSNRVNAFIMSP